MISTTAGDLHVEVDGNGPWTVLWHSLFVDSRSWSRLRAHVHDRRFIVVDGPGHGRSGAPRDGFTFYDCAVAAAEVLDALEVDGPVDWVGNAWGGHVGLLVAAHSPQRLRSLVTIATPAHALTRTEQVKIAPMVALYRRVGAIGPLARGVARSILGADFMSAHPADTDRVVRSLAEAPRVGMHRAMVAAMLKRPDITGLLPASRCRR